jgi:hypothetical protein
VLVCTNHETPETPRDFDFLRILARPEAETSLDESLENAELLRR